MSSIFSYQPKKPQITPVEPSAPSIFRAKQPNQSTIPEEQSVYPFEGENDLQREIERNTARGLSRMGERVLGLPGDIASFIQGVTGKKTEEFPLPTSSQLKEKSEKLTKGYTAPKTPFEEKIDEYMGDVANMMLPGGQAKGFGLNLARTIGSPLAGNLMQEGMKYSGKDEKSAATGKMGTMVVLDLLFNRGKGGARGYANNLLKEAEQSIPSGQLVRVANLENSLNQLEQVLQKGGARASRNPALSRINDIRGRIQNGNIDPKEFPEIRTAINEAIEQLGGWNAEMPPNIQRRAVSNLNKVKGEVIRAGEEYGATQNPEFLQKWKSGNEASAAVQQSNVISNFIKRRFGDKFRSTATKFLFGLGGPGAVSAAVLKPGAALAGGTIAGATTAGYQAYKVISRVRNSPTLRKYYTNVLKASAEGNASEMVQNMNLLDKKLADEEKKEKALIEKHTQD